MDIHTLTSWLGRLLCMGGMAVTGVASAADYYVAPWGDDSHDGLSWETAMKSPEVVVVDRWNNTAGHTLTISNGTYKLTKRMSCKVNGSGVFKIKSLTGKPEDVVLDGQGQCGGIYLYGAYNSVVEGLTVTNCVVTDLDGAGIFFRDTGGQIRNCIVSDCHVKVKDKGSSGGGIYALTSVLSGCRVENCSIENTDGAVGKTANGGGIYAYRTKITNSVVYACSIRMNSGTCYPSGGGIYAVDNGEAYSSDDRLPGVYDTEIKACEITLPYVSGGSGAGLYISCSAPDGVDGRCYQAVVNNCLISSCTNWYYGPLTAAQHTDIVNTTVTNCYDKASIASENHGTGIWLSGARNNVRGSLVAENVGTVGSDYGGGTPAVRMGSDCVLVDSAIVGNRGTSRIALQLASGALVSNCLFRANVQTAAVRGGLIYTADHDEGSKAEIVDCYFVENDCAQCTWGGWIWFNNKQTQAYEVRFRNCLCADNKLGKGGALVYSNGSAKTASQLNAIFENCTIVNNEMSSTSYSMLHGYYENNDLTWVSAYRIFLHGCIVVGNTGGQGQVQPRIFATTNNVNYTVMTPNAGQAFHPDSVGNKAYDPALPLFVDADAKDYRMAMRSQACDMVPASAWMGTGRKKGPQDLGSGCEMAAVGDYGVTISRLDASCRLSGELADAGCTEYQKKLGLMLLFR